MRPEKSIDELMEDLDRSAAEMGSATTEAALDERYGKPEKVLELPEMDFSQSAAKEGGVAEQDAATAPPPAAEPPPKAPQPPARPVVRTPPLAPAAPPASGRGTPDWDSLLKRNARGLLLDDVVNAGNRALSRYSAQPPESHSSQQLAAMPLEMAKQEQAFDRGNLALDSQRAALDAGAASRDPNSAQSQKQREAWKAMGLPTPLGFDEWSAADIKAANAGDFTRVMQLKAAAEERARKAKAETEKAEAKAKADAEKLEAAKRDLNSARQNWAEELKAIGIDPETASQKDIDRAISMKHANATEHVAASNLAIAQANRRDKDDDKKALGESIPFAGGELKYTGSGTPREDERKKVLDIASSGNAALESMNDLEGSLARFATNPGVDSKRDVDSKVRVTSAALNAAIGGGAMSDAEALAMANALGANVTSPAGIEAALNHLIGDDPRAAQTLLTRLNSVRSGFRKTVLGKMKPFRFSLSGEAAEKSDVPVEETRVISGKTYRKKNGKWVTDG